LRQGPLTRILCRHFRNWSNAGARVEVVIATTQSDLQGVPHPQLRTLRQMGIAILQSHDAGVSEAISSGELRIDALLGYSLHGKPREPHATLKRQANQVSAVRVYLDVPSGLDSSTGTSHDPTIFADATLTLAWPKTGMLTADAYPFTG
jgi:NAD(P)H-hydrate epimerase